MVPLGLADRLSLAPAAGPDRHPPRRRVRPRARHRATSSSGRSPRPARRSGRAGPGAAGRHRRWRPGSTSGSPSRPGWPAGRATRPRPSTGRSRRGAATLTIHERLRVAAPARLGRPVLPGRRRRPRRGPRRDRDAAPRDRRRAARRPARDAAGLARDRRRSSPLHDRGPRHGRGEPDELRPPRRRAPRRPFRAGAARPGRDPGRGQRPRRRRGGDRAGPRRRCAAALSRRLGRPVGQSGSGPTMWVLYPSLARGRGGRRRGPRGGRDGELPVPGDGRAVRRPRPRSRARAAADRSDR